VIEEAARPLVECRDCGQVLLAQFEIEHREILGHAILADRLGDRHDAPLDEPAQNHLRDRLAMPLADRAEQVILEQAVLPFGERPPRLGLDAMFAKQCLGFRLLMERMDFDLVAREKR